jgi:uncharacterized protein (DUF433 family)
MAEQVVVSDPEVMNGTPCFRGTRVPFKNLTDYLKGGHPLGDFLRQFPTVTQEMAVRALEEAKESLIAKNCVKVLLDELSASRFLAQLPGTRRS